MSSQSSYQITATRVANTTAQIADTHPNWCRRCSLMDQMHLLPTFNRARVCLGPYLNTLEFSREPHLTESTAQMANLLTDTLRFATTLRETHGLNATTLVCRFALESPSGYNPESMEHLSCLLGFESKPRTPEQASTLDHLIQLFGQQPGGLVSFYSKDLASGPSDTDTMVRRLPFDPRYLDPNELNKLVLQVFAEASGVTFTYGKHGLSIFIGLQNGYPQEMTLVAHRLGR